MNIDVSNKVDIMNLGVEKAQYTMTMNMGGPFGAVIVKDGKIISVASNTVLENNDPTAHAEINAIRSACNRLGTYDLTGCELYATGYPCPMCLSAIMWANIRKVYYGCTPKDADAIGFRDDFIYDFINKYDFESHGCEGTLTLEQVGRDECIKLFEQYQEMNKTIY